MIGWLLPLLLSLLATAICRAHQPTWNRIVQSKQSTFCQRGVLDGDQRSSPCSISIKKKYSKKQQQQQKYRSTVIGKKGSRKWSPEAFHHVAMNVAHASGTFIINLPIAFIYDKSIPWSKGYFGLQQKDFSSISALRFFSLCRRYRWRRCVYGCCWDSCTTPDIHIYTEALNKR